MKTLKLSLEKIQISKLETSLIKGGHRGDGHQNNTGDEGDTVNPPICLETSAVIIDQK